ncbi:MAG: transcription elongation factor GreA [Bacillota bacterium]
MSEKEVILSLEGLRKFEQELEYLKSVKRREVAERIKQAREFGDISENSEYDDAKNEQAFIEGRILTLEKILRNAKLIDEVEVDPDVANIGSTVKLEDLETGEIEEYTLVSTSEANPAENRISDESPVGKGLMGQRVGQIVEVKVPAGTIKYKVLAIVR